MLRWGLKHVFKSVTIDDFKSAVSTVKDAIEKSYGPVAVQIDCYAGLKHSVTTVDDAVTSFVNEQNSKHVTTKITDLNDLTPEIWNNTAFIEAHIKPKESKRHDSTYAYVETKGRLPCNMNFYVQGPAAVVEAVSQAAGSKPGLWHKNDGYNSNHLVTLG